MAKIFYDAFLDAPPEAWLRDRSISKLAVVGMSL